MTSQPNMPVDGTTVVDGVPVHHVSIGAGLPVLALHGLYSAHEEVRAFLEPFFGARPGYRRIYLDLPSMGATPAPEHIIGSDGVLAIVLGAVDALIGNEPLLLIGHSYGGYLARGVANRRPGQVRGLAAICPAMTIGQYASEHTPIQVDDGIDNLLSPDEAAEFRQYFVTQTPQTAQAFRTAVGPVLGRTDIAALTRILEDWELHPSPEHGLPSDVPSLIVTGRHDSIVGAYDAWELVAHYQHATFATLDAAGHALPHEQPVLLAALLDNWLDRVHAPANKPAG